MTESRSAFSTFFPPPISLSMPSVGINISDHSIKMLELKDEGKRLMLGEYATANLPPGAVVNGKVQKTEVVVDALRGLRSTFGIEFVRSSIPEEEGYIFSVVLPKGAERDMYEALEFRLSEQVPLAVSEAVFDYTVIGVNKHGETEVNVSVLPRGVVETHINLFEQAGLVPLSLEIEAQTIARSVVDRHSKEALVIVDIGRTRTGVAIADRQVVRYTSTLPMGGDAFVAAIVKHRGVSATEAEEIKQRVGIVPMEHDEKLREELGDAVQTIATEISRRIEFWNAQVSKRAIRSNPVSGVILCGGNATMPGLREALASLVSTRVEVANVWRNLFTFEEIIPPIDFHHSLGYASSIGLCLTT